MTELNISGYIVHDELRSDNAGNSLWGVCFRDGTKYFIKQLKETYYDIPLAEATPFQREDMEASARFYERMLRLFDRLKEADNGNLVVPLDFIRQNGHYYIISEWVDQFSDFSEIQSFTPLQKHVMLRVLAYSLCGLAEQQIVHSDLKPDNIRIKDTISRARTLKIIDFDSSFIQGDYPDLIGGTQNYMAPEAIIRMYQDEDGAAEKIEVTPKADIFSLGIIFHEILTGELPQSSDPAFPYPGIAVGRGIDLRLHPRLEPEYEALIRRMLLVEPQQRPEAKAVFETLRQIDPLTMQGR
mgnify:CR=1 FL=1